MFNIFGKVGLRTQAIKTGRLLDMKKKPYRTVNQAVGVPFALSITPAAFDEFIALTDTPAHRQLVKSIRWGNILAALTSLQPSLDSAESVFDVNVIEPDGALKTKAIKVIAGLDDNGREAFTFLLPEEADPVVSAALPLSR
jgi:hypothetical protein